MIEEFVAKACVACGKQFKPQVPQHKLCDGCFSKRDKKSTALSSADTTVTMTPAAQESFQKRRKFKTAKKNAKRWSKKGGASSSSSPAPAKKAKSGAVLMLTTHAFDDEGSAEQSSKTMRLSPPAVEDDQPADDESDDELEGAASSSKSGGVTSVLRPEGVRDFYDTHLMAKYVYTGPNFSTKKASEPAATAKAPPVFKKKVHRKKLAEQKLATGKGKKVEGPATSDNEGSFERPAKKPASSASDDDHSLLLSTLTGGHGVFMAQAEAIERFQLAQAEAIIIVAQKEGDHTV